jgi:hypothetical protein
MYDLISLKRVLSKNSRDGGKMPTVIRADVAVPVFRGRAGWRVIRR